MLTGPLVDALLDRVRAAGLYQRLSWAGLPELVLAVRYAWLSEWLRRDDADMVSLELDYMRLLRDRRAELQSAWNVPWGWALAASAVLWPVASPVVERRKA